jgi:hypothetical protein
LHIVNGALSKRYLRDPPGKVDYFFEQGARHDAPAPRASEGWSPFSLAGALASAAYQKNGRCLNRPF